MKTVLIADDDPTVRRLLTAILGERYRVVEAATGTEAVALAHRERPDLALIDVAMPQLNGREVVRQLRRDPLLGALRVLLISGLSNNTSSEIPVDGYVTKPFSPAALLTAVERVIGR